MCHANLRMPFFKMNPKQPDKQFENEKRLTTKDTVLALSGMDITGGRGVMDTYGNHLERTSLEQTWYRVSSLT